MGVPLAPDPRVTPLCPELIQPAQTHSPQIRFAYPRPFERVYSPPHRSPHYRGAPTKRRGGRGGWGDGRITPGPAFGSRGGGAGGEAHRASPQSGQHTVHLPSRLTVPKIPSRRVALGVSSTPNTVRRRPAHSARGRPLAHGTPNPEAIRPSGTPARPIAPLPATNRHDLSPRFDPPTGADHGRRERLGLP